MGFLTRQKLGPGTWHPPPLKQSDILTWLSSIKISLSNASCVLVSISVDGIFFAFSMDCLCFSAFIKSIFLDKWAWRRFSFLFPNNNKKWQCFIWNTSASSTPTSSSCVGLSCSRFEFVCLCFLLHTIFVRTRSTRVKPKSSATIYLHPRPAWSMASCYLLLLSDPDDSDLFCLLLPRLSSFSDSTWFASFFFIRYVLVFWIVHKECFSPTLVCFFFSFLLVSIEFDCFNLIWPWTIQIQILILYGI